MEKLVPVNDIAEYLTVSPKTVYHWVHIGYIPHYRLPKAVRFKLSEIESWIDRRKRKGRESYKINIES